MAQLESSPGDINSPQIVQVELGFDYLRDQMAPSPSELALREQSPFNFAVVDEVCFGSESI